MTKAERTRSAARRRKSKETDFQTGIAETAGIAAGTYAAGRFGLAGRPLAGPLTMGAAIGLGGAVAKMIMPGVDKSPILSAVTSGAVAVGATELFLLGASHRAAAGG